MPYKMGKTKGGKYTVSGPSGVHAKGTTKNKAEAQMNLLRGVEHGWKPTGVKTKVHGTEQYSKKVGGKYRTVTRKY